MANKYSISKLDRAYVFQLPLKWEMHMMLSYKYNCA